MTFTSTSGSQPLVCEAHVAAFPRVFFSHQAGKHEFRALGVHCISLARNYFNFKNDSQGHRILFFTIVPHYIHYKRILTKTVC